MIHEMDREALIFLDLPKLTGRYLNRITEWQFSPFSIFKLDPYRIPATAERFKILFEQRRPRSRLVFWSLHRRLEKARLRGEDCLRKIFHRQRFQCRLITGVEETAISNERLLDVAKTMFAWGASF